MDGLMFKELNNYQTLVVSENHEIVLTDVVKKYGMYLNKAKFNAVVSFILIILSCSLTIWLVYQAIASDFRLAQLSLIAGSIILGIISAAIFHSSRWDISKFTEFIDQYEE